MPTVSKKQKKFISNYFANIAINSESKRLGEYIEIEKIYNTEKKYNTADVKGIAITKEFIKTKANLSNVDITKYQIVNTKSFAFATNTSRMGDKLAIALNRGAPILVSQIYPVFKKYFHLMIWKIFLYLFQVKIFKCN